MIRGTTPTLEFTLPFDTGQLAAAWVTISVDGSEVINKTLEECEREACVLRLRLTQQETLQLPTRSVAEIQIRARTTEGEAIASSIIPVRVDRILRDGVI